MASDPTQVSTWLREKGRMAVFGKKGCENV